MFPSISLSFSIPLLRFKITYSSFEVFLFSFFFFFSFFHLFCFSLLVCSGFLRSPVCCIFSLFFSSISSFFFFLFVSRSFFFVHASFFSFFYQIHSSFSFLIFLMSWYRSLPWSSSFKLRFETPPCGRELAICTKSYYVVYRNTYTTINMSRNIIKHNLRTSMNEQIHFFIKI